MGEILQGREWGIFAVVFAVFMACLYGFVLKPFINGQLELARAQNLQAQQKISELEHFRKDLLADDGFIDDLRIRYKRLLNAVPEELEQGELIFELQRLANQSEVELVELAPISEDMPNADTVPRRLSLRIILRADYFRLLDFLQGLQDVERYIAVDSMTISAENGEKNLKVELRLTAFSLAE